MTIFGWDASNWDDPPASRDGIDFYTHKVTEGDHFYFDAEYSTSIAAAHHLGIPVLGSYHVQHGGKSIGSQAAWWVDQVESLSPWWRQQPAWIWQIDAEKFDYMTAPTIAEVNALGDEVVRLTGCPRHSVVAYAPHWLYGSALSGLRYPIWASDYGTNAAGPYRTTYPGDTSSRWAGNPLILQYSSQATIAGQTTSDANAYRGTIDQLIAALNGGNTMAYDATIEAHNAHMYGFTLASMAAQTPPLTDQLGKQVVVTNTLAATLIRMETKLDGLLTAIGAIGTTNPDVAAILAGVDASLAALKTALEADLAHEHQVTAAAAKAEADTLAAG